MVIIQKHSPNYRSRCGWPPDVIVCHITDGAFDGACAWLCSEQSGISAHFVVARDGRIAQLVDLRNAAYCNGTQSGSPSGYEYVGRATAEIVKARRVNANLYTVSIECEGDSSTHGILTDAQFAALVELIGYIRQQIKSIYGSTISYDRTHLLGHCEIAPKEKPDCPGRSFPWAQLVSTLNGQPPALAPIVHIDIPGVGKAVSGAFPVGGWALKVDRVDVYADVGTPHQTGIASIRELQPRPDVGRAYPQYSDSTQSGWCAMVPAGRLAPGDHSIDAAGITKSGPVWVHQTIIVK